MRAILLGTLLTLLMSTPVWAQGYGRDFPRWEITPMVGFETGASAPVPINFDINGNPTTFVDRVGIDKALSYGGWFDYSLTEYMQFEFMWARNSTSYTEHDFSVNKEFKAYDADVNAFQFGLVYTFMESKKLRPYMAVGLGFVHDSHSNGTTDTAFAYSAGGGVKYFFAKHLGTRADVRFIPSRASTTQGLVCDPYYGCYYGDQRNYFKRVNFAGGLVFRF